MSAEGQHLVHNVTTDHVTELADFRVDALSCGDVFIDLIARRVTQRGRAIHLGPTAFALLQYMMRYPNRVFSRRELYDAIWGPYVHVQERTVDVHVRQIRKALGSTTRSKLIQTVRGVGYGVSNSDFSLLEERTKMMPGP